MYELLKKDGMAKRGRFHTVHGTIETPVFMNVGTAAKKLPEPWFGGYVDVTATPSYEFESKVGNVYRNVILGFVTAGDGCQPSWGGYYTLDEAASTLDLDSRIAQTYKTDRTVTVSFGGQNGTELASACSDVDSLADAYQQVIDRYHITSLDFDIENKNLDGYSETATRRAQAVAKLIANEKAKNKGKDDTSHDLIISLTLPADAKGLTTQGMQTVNAFLDAGVTLSTVNLMTMDFNVASTSITQSTLIKSSLNAAHAQYKTLLYSRGKLFSDHQIWELLEPPCSSARTTPKTSISRSTMRAKSTRSRWKQAWAT